MIWTCAPDEYPDGVDDQRAYGGSVVDASGKKWGVELPARYINCKTGEVICLKRPMEDDGMGRLLMVQHMLPAPLLIYSRTGELLNPEDEVPVSEPTVV